MAKETKTQGSGESETPIAEPTATPVTDQALSDPSGGGQEPVQGTPSLATPEGGGQTESFEEITADRYQELLEIEKRHKDQNKQYGRAINEVGELRKRLQDVENRQTGPAPFKPALPEDIRLTDEDVEDPSRFVGKINKAFERVITQPASGTGLTREDVRLILLQEKAAEVIESDPVLESMGFDEQGIPRAMGLVDQAAAWAMVQNQQAGRIVFRDPKSAWEGFKKVLSGTLSSEPAMTAQEARKVIVKQLKQSGTPAVSVGPSGPAESVVDKYKNLLKNKDRKQIGAFYAALSDEDKKKIDIAVSEMEEGP